MPRCVAPPRRSVRCFAPSIRLSCAFGHNAPGCLQPAWDAFMPARKRSTTRRCPGITCRERLHSLMPADITNAFNGQSTLSVKTDLDGLPITWTFLSLAGLLTLPIGGTPLWGLVRGLYYASQQLANAIYPVAGDGHGVRRTSLGQPSAAAKGTGRTSPPCLPTWSHLIPCLIA
jgi:hypothetical protein